MSDAQTTDFGRTPINDAIRDQIRVAFDSLPDKKRGAVLVIADDHGVRGHLAGRFGENWKVAAGAGFNYGEKRPAGYVSVEFAW
jgi:hypothetical protein